MASSTGGGTHYRGSIMPRDCIDIPEVEEVFGITFSWYDADPLFDVLPLRYSFGDVDLYAGTHILLAGLPLSVFALRVARPDTFRFDERFNLEPPILAAPRKPWYLVRKWAFPETVGLPLSDQLAHVRGREAVPTVSELVYAVTLYYWVTGCRLLEDVYLRARGAPKQWDPAWKGLGFCVGGFTRAGLDIRLIEDSDAAADVGLASMALSPQNLCEPETH